MLLLCAVCAGLVVWAPAQTTRNRAKTKKPAPTPVPQAVGGITPRRVGEPAPTPPPPGTPPKRYALKGKVTDVHPSYSLVEVEHEAIADYMEAMTMKFPLKDAKLLARLKRGDRITATLVVSQTSGDWWLENVVVKK